MLDSPEQQLKTLNTIQRIVEANLLGTNGPKVMNRVRKHKAINTMEGHMLYSKSSADANIVDRLRLCNAILESVTNELNHTPLGNGPSNACKTTQTACIVPQSSHAS